MFNNFPVLVGEGQTDLEEIAGRNNGGYAELDSQQSVYKSLTHVFIN